MAKSFFFDSANPADFENGIALFAVSGAANDFGGSLLAFRNASYNNSYTPPGGPDVFIDCGWLRNASQLPNLGSEELSTIVHAPGPLLLTSFFFYDESNPDNTTVIVNSLSLSAFNETTELRNLSSFPKTGPGYLSDVHVRDECPLVIGFGRSGHGWEPGAISVVADRKEFLGNLTNSSVDGTTLWHSQQTFGNYWDAGLIHTFDCNESFGYFGRTNGGKGDSYGVMRTLDGGRSWKPPAERRSISIRFGSSQIQRWLVTCLSISVCCAATRL